ncbi:hypothetical protein KEM55_000315 [Ascosphaera atra]|nr:hypothetical protein KEM55_000315 [Ascosphaera atra]
MFMKTAVTLAAALAVFSPVVLGKELNEKAGAPGAAGHKVDSAKSKVKGKETEHTDLGQVTIQNNCDKDVYLWSIADSGDVKSEKLSNGGSYSEHYRANPNGGGVSIKLNTENSQSKVSQFEYTLQDNKKVYYDWSNIDGYPFQSGGVTVQPSESDCPTITCAAGVANCDQAYNQPKDDYATHGCNIKANFNVQLCSGGSGSSSSGKKVVGHPHGKSKQQ